MLVSGPAFTSLERSINNLPRGIGSTGGQLSDWMIKKHVGIDPMVEMCPENGISYGLSSYGYDMRLDRKFKKFTNINGAIVDPKNFDTRVFVDYEGDTCLIPPNSFVLGVSMERFTIPREILALCVGKSTYARCGIGVTLTPAEPEWEGHLTIEIANHSPCPAMVYAGEGIAQVVFLMAPFICERSYKDKKGRYDKQPREPTVPFVR